MTSIFGWLKGKAIWSIVVVVAVYLGGLALGIIPDSVKSGVGWFADNFTMLAVLAMFLVGAYVFHEYTEKKRGKTE